MYKIVACFKITDDYDELSSSDWEMVGEDGYPVTDFVRRIIGCFDEAALENSLILKNCLQKRQIETQVTAVTLNPGYSEHIMRRLKAAGIDRVVSLETKESMDFSPKQTAGILADFIRKEGDVNLVLTGLQSAPGNTGCVPYFMAAALGMPVWNAVVRFETDDEKMIAVCEYPDEYAGYQMDSPGICVMGNTERSFLRIPTLREKMLVKNYVPEQIIIESDLIASRPEFHVINQKRHCILVEMQEAVELIQKTGSEEL